jgi:hypothetical protein
MGTSARASPHCAAVFYFHFKAERGLAGQGSDYSWEATHEADAAENHESDLALEINCAS